VLDEARPVFSVSLAFAGDKFKIHRLMYLARPLVPGK